jgi:chromatin segregation and condensation protein Rec8/ScpA/Scc1 (kleisin family)
VNDLTEALERYAIYKKATKNLDKTWGVAYLAPFRKELKLPVYFVPTQDLTVGDISQALTKMVTSLPALAPSYPKAKVQKTISIEDMIERLRARVLSGVQTSFRDSASNSHRGDVIVLFLALLELVKLGAIDAEQSEQHDDIIIRAAQPQEQVV